LKRVCVIGTRGSDLALWQANHIKNKMQATLGFTCELKVITTQGDLSLQERLVGKLEKGFFTRELETALRRKEIDVAVHSLKDLPTRLDADVVIGAIDQRMTASDLLIVSPSFVIDSEAPDVLPIKRGIRVGASSLRRESLLRRYAPQSIPALVRGNVPTRLAKLRAGKVDAMVLAAAGIHRLQLSLSNLCVFELNPRVWQPAPGQGAIAVECRAEDDEMSQSLKQLEDGVTSHAVNWERAYLRVLEGGCATPFGCYVENQTAFLGIEHQDEWHTLHVEVPGDPPSAEDEPLIHSHLSRLRNQNIPAENEWLYQRQS